MTKAQSLGKLVSEDDDSIGFIVPKAAFGRKILHWHVISTGVGFYTVSGLPQNDIKTLEGRDLFILWRGELLEETS
jgi:hypothetical protein